LQKHRADRRDLVAHLSARRIFVGRFIFQQIGFWLSANCFLAKFRNEKKNCLIMTRVSRSTGVLVGQNTLTSVAPRFSTK